MSDGRETARQRPADPELALRWEDSNNGGGGGSRGLPWEEETAKIRDEIAAMPGVETDDREHRYREHVVQVGWGGGVKNEAAALDHVRPLDLAAAPQAAALLHPYARGFSHWWVAEPSGTIVLDSWFALRRLDEREHIEQVELIDRKLAERAQP